MKDQFTNFNKKHFFMALFLDLIKAFDVVNQDILLKKFELCRFCGRASEFLPSYLTDRNNIPLILTNNLYKNLGLLKFTDIHKSFLLKIIHFV